MITVKLFLTSTRQNTFINYKTLNIFHLQFLSDNVVDNVDGEFFCKQNSQNIVNAFIYLDRFGISSLEVRLKF